MGVEHPPEANPEYVQTTDHYHHVRVRPSDAFAAFRTPLATDTESPLDEDGYDVRVGRAGPDRWLVESVLVPRAAVVYEEGAEREARRLVAHFEDGHR